MLKKSRLFAFAQTSSETINFLKSLLLNKKTIIMEGRALVFDYAKTTKKLNENRLGRSIQLFFDSSSFHVVSLVKILLKWGLRLEWYSFIVVDSTMELRVRLLDTNSVKMLLSASAIFLGRGQIIFETCQKSQLSSSKRKRDIDYIYKHQMYFNMVYEQKSDFFKPKVPRTLEGQGLWGLESARMASRYINQATTNIRLNFNRNLSQKRKMTAKAFGMVINQISSQVKVFSIRKNGLEFNNNIIESTMGYVQ